MAKDAKEKKPKEKKAAKSAPSTGGDGKQLPSVASHPRAGAQVARAKSAGGLAGFGLAAFLSWRAHVPMPDLLLRAIAAGIVTYVAAWAAAVAVWRHLVLAELRAVRAHLAAERAATAIPREPAA
jgi:hypothetical protein